MSDIYHTVINSLRALNRCPLIVPVSAAGYNGMPSNVKPTNTVSGKDSIASKPGNQGQGGMPSYVPDSQVSQPSSSGSGSSSSNGGSSSNAGTGGSYTADQERKKAEERRRQQEEEQRRREQEEKERQARILEQRAKQAEYSRQTALNQAKIADEQKRIADEQAAAAAKAQPTSTVTINGNTMAAGGYATAKNEMKKAGVVQSSKSGFYEAQTAQANAATSARVAAGEVAAASTFLGNAVKDAAQVSQLNAELKGKSGYYTAEQEMKKASTAYDSLTASLSEKDAFVQALQRIYNRYGSDIEKGSVTATKAAEEAILRAEHLILKGKSWDRPKEDENLKDYASARNLTTAEDLKTAQAIFDAENLKKFMNDKEYAKGRSIINGKVVWVGEPESDAHMLNLFSTYDRIARNSEKANAVSKAVTEYLGLTGDEIANADMYGYTPKGYTELFNACMNHDCTPQQYVENKEWFINHPNAKYSDMAHMTVRLATTADIAELQKDNTSYVQVFLENSNRWKYTAADKNMYVGNQTLGTDYTGLAYYNPATGEFIRIARDSDKSQTRKNAEAKAAACNTIADFNTNKYAAAINKIDRLTQGYGLVAAAMNYIVEHSGNDTDAINNYIMATALYDSHASEIDALVAEAQTAFDKATDFRYQANKYVEAYNNDPIVYADKAYEEKMDDAYAQSRIANAEAQKFTGSALDFESFNTVNSIADVAGVFVHETKKLIGNIGTQGLIGYAASATDKKPSPYDDIVNKYCTKIGDTAVTWFKNSAIYGIKSVFDQVQIDRAMNKELIERGKDPMASRFGTYAMAYIVSPALNELAETFDVVLNAAGLKAAIIAASASANRGALDDNAYTMYLRGNVNLATASYDEIFKATYKYMNGGAADGVRAIVDWSDTTYSGQMSKGGKFVLDLIVDTITDPMTYVDGGIFQLFGFKGLKGAAGDAISELAGKAVKNSARELLEEAGYKVTAEALDVIVDTYKKALKHSDFGKGIKEAMHTANEAMAARVVASQTPEALEALSSTARTLGKGAVISEAGNTVQSLTKQLDDITNTLRRSDALTGIEKVRYTAAATTVDLARISDTLQQAVMVTVGYPVAGAMELVKGAFKGIHWIRTVGPNLVKLDGQMGALAIARKYTDAITELSDDTITRMRKAADAAEDSISTETKVLSKIDPSIAADLEHSMKEFKDSVNTGKCIDAAKEILNADKRALELYDVSDLPQRALKYQALSGVRDRLQSTLDSLERGIQGAARDCDRIALISARNDVLTYFAKADKELATGLQKVYNDINNGVKLMRNSFKANTEAIDIPLFRERVVSAVREAQHDSKALMNVLGEHNINFGVQEYIDIIDDFDNLADSFNHMFNPIMADETEAIAHYICALDDLAQSVDDILKSISRIQDMADDYLCKLQPTVTNWRNHPLLSNPAAPEGFQKSDLMQRSIESLTGLYGKSDKSMLSLESRISTAYIDTLDKTNLAEASNIYMFNNTPQKSVQTYLKSEEAQVLMDALRGKGDLAPNFSALTAIDGKLGKKLGRRFGSLNVSEVFYNCAEGSEYMKHILGAYQNSHADEIFKRISNIGNLNKNIDSLTDEIVANANLQIAHGNGVDTKHWHFECNTPDVEKNVDNMIAVLSEKMGEPDDNTIRVFFSLDNKGGVYGTPNAYCFKVQNGPSLTHYVDNFKTTSLVDDAHYKAHGMSFDEYKAYIDGMDVSTVSSDKMHQDMYDFITALTEDEAHKGMHIEFVGFNTRSSATSQADTLRQYFTRTNTPVHFDGIIDGSEYFHNVSYLSDAEVNAINAGLHNAYIEYERVAQRFGDCTAIVRTDTHWKDLTFAKSKQDIGKFYKDASAALRAVNTKGQLMVDEVAQQLAYNTGSLNHLMIDKHALEEAMSWYLDKPVSINMREFIDAAFGPDGDIGISTIHNKYRHEFWGDLPQDILNKVPDLRQYEKVFDKADALYSSSRWMQGVQQLDFDKCIELPELAGIEKYMKGIMEQATLHPVEASQLQALSAIYDHAIKNKRLDNLLVALNIAQTLEKRETPSLTKCIDANSQVYALYTKVFDKDLVAFSYAGKNAPLLAKLDQDMSKYALFGAVDDVLKNTGTDYLTARHLQEDISGVNDLVNRRSATLMGEARSKLKELRDSVYSGITAVKDGANVIEQLDDAKAIAKARKTIEQMGSVNRKTNLEMIKAMSDEEFEAYMINNAKGVMIVQQSISEDIMERNIPGFNFEFIDSNSVAYWIDFRKVPAEHLDEVLARGKVLRPDGVQGKYSQLINWLQNNVFDATYGFSNGHRMHAEYLNGLYDTLRIPAEARLNVDLHKNLFDDAYDCSVIGDTKFLRRYNEFAASTELDILAQGVRTATEHVSAAEDILAYATSKANNMKYNMERYNLNYKLLEEEGIGAYTLRVDKNGLPTIRKIDWKTAEKAADRAWLLDEFTVQSLKDQVHGLRVAVSPERVQAVYRALDRWKMTARALNVAGWLFMGSFVPAAGMRNWRDAVPKASYYDRSGQFLSYLVDAPKRNAMYEETLQDIIARGCNIDDAGIAGYFKAMGSDAVMSEKAFRQMHATSTLGSSTLGDILGDQLKKANEALAKELGLPEDTVNRALKKINEHLAYLSKKGRVEDRATFWSKLNADERRVYENFVRVGGYQNKLTEFITKKFPPTAWNAREFGRVEDVVRGALRNMYLDAGFSSLKTEHLVNMSQYNYATTGHLTDWFPFVQFKLCNMKTWAYDLVKDNPGAIRASVREARLADYAFDREAYMDLFNMIGYRDKILADPDRYLNNPDEDEKAWYQQYVEYCNNFDGVNRLYGQGIPLGNDHFIKDGDSFATMHEFVTDVADLVFAVFNGDENMIWDGLANVTYEPLVTALHTVRTSFPDITAFMHDIKGKSFTDVASLIAGKAKNADLSTVENLVSMVPFINTLYSTIKRDFKYGALNIKALAAMGTAGIETIRETRGSLSEYLLGIVSGVVGTRKVDEQEYKDLYSWMQKNPATYVDWYGMCQKMGLSGDSISWFLDSVFGDDRPQSLMYDMSMLHDTLLYLTERGYTPEEIDKLLTNRKSWLWTSGTVAMQKKDVLDQAKKILDNEVYNQLPDYIKYGGSYKDLLDFYVETRGLSYYDARIAMLKEHPYISPDGNVHMMDDKQFKEYIQYEGQVMSKYEDQIPAGITYSNGEFSVDRSVYELMRRKGLTFEDALKYCIENNVWWNNEAKAFSKLTDEYVNNLNEQSQVGFDDWWGKINKYIAYTPGLYRVTADRMKLLGFSTEAMRRAMEQGIYFDRAANTFRQAGSMDGMYYDKKTGQWREWIDYQKMWDLGWYYKNGEWHQRWNGNGNGWVDYKALYAEMWEKGYYWKNGEWHKWINYGSGKGWVNYGKKWRDGYYFKDGKWHKWIDYSQNQRWRKSYDDYGTYTPKKPKSTKTPGSKKKWKGANLLLQPYARHCFAKNVYRVDLRKYRDHSPMSTKSSMPSTYRHIRYSENRRNIYDQQYAKYGLSRMTMRSGMWRGQNSPSTTRLRRNRVQYNEGARAVNNRTWNQYNTQASSKRSK